MPKFEMSIPHNLDHDALRERVEGTIEHLKRRFQLQDVEQKWVGSTLQFAFTTKGFRINGSIHLYPSEVAVEANLPMVAAMFKKRIEADVRQALQQVLQS
jgi:putative polyhydroxyalkanoate system protein